MKRLVVSVLFATAVECGLAAAQTVDVPYVDAKPILDALREDLLPAELRATPPAQQEAAWPSWVKRRDAEIRERLARGDEDSLVNLVLFGSSFTMKPRATTRQLDELGGSRSAPAAQLVLGRIEDLVAGIASPGTNERLQFARQVVERKGLNPGARLAVQQFLIEIMTRVATESDAYDRALQSAERVGEPGARLATLSTLFRERGLSSDTAIFPNFALDQALEAVVKAKGLLAPGSVRRVAIVGPGLDFVDKGTGYDFYPEQTIQPFAVADSLRRLGLVAVDDLRVTTFDLSPRIIHHIDTARDRAQTGNPYVLQLPRPRDESWNPALVKYWEAFGSTIGEEIQPLPPPPGAGNVQVRAVRVRPQVVTATVPQDLNIVLQRLDPLPAGDQFDLVIATNILVYYDVFEQSLALVNIAKMLRPGGLFLTNDAIVELPATPLESVGSIEVVYGDKAGESRVGSYRK